MPTLGQELIPDQVEEFKYLRVFFTSDMRREQDIDRCIGPAAAVRQMLYRGEEERAECKSAQITGRSSSLPSPIVTSCG